MDAQSGNKNFTRVECNEESEELRRIPESGAQFQPC